MRWFWNGATPSAETPDLHDEDIRYQTLRASGPGGQHVDKTDSAVRATHLPTGLATLSQDQRWQFANKNIARIKLAMFVDHGRRADEAGRRRALWGQNRELERGNAVRTYEGQRFRRRQRTTYVSRRGLRGINVRSCHSVHGPLAIIPCEAIPNGRKWSYSVEKLPCGWGGVLIQ